MEYPKVLYRKGWDDTTDCMIVYDAKGEADVRSSGFSDLGDHNGMQIEKTPEEVKPRGRHRKV